MNRLRPILDKLLHRSQHCGVAGRGIFDAVAMIRDSIAYAEMSHVPLCILCLDFTEAFDRIAHRYLFRLLTKCGFSTKFIALIENMYNHAHSSIHINGHTTGPILIQCSVRQGCPMSMLLFALLLNPLLTLLDQKIMGIRIGRRMRTTVVAYADDITLFVTSPADIPGVREAIQTYERATDASLNIRKSKALVAGSWDVAIDMMGISYCTDINILGIHFTNSIAQSVNTS